MSKHSEALDKLRALSDEELHAHLVAQRRKLFEIRLQQATGQVENTSQIRLIRREIARAMTVELEAQRTQ
ncbi:MAG TPA: 50S ribosomal protein L29 [Candidatus Dormibacteraeota bacterium]|nr:50S ribosomal protein L29 [Candidatus Dormibacteraeota bacterium]